jgi:hypothetical protein
LLMVDGTAAEVEKARNVIATTQPTHVALHAPEAVGASAE